MALACLPVQSAFAAEKTMVACISKNSGAVTIRSRCASSERKLSLSALQVAAQVGPKGDAGAQGPKGDRGEPGLPGANGLNGVNGAVGAKGDKGDRGDVGPVGATGPTGATGPVGPQGAVGPQGPVGATGPVGAQGPVGPQGVVGATGAQGPMGPEGARGLSGFSTIPSGTTVFGAIGGDYHSATAGGEWGATSSMLGIPPVNFGNELVVVKNNVNVDNECGGGTCLHQEELAYGHFCNGTVEAPSASPGWVCIYPTQDTNASQVRSIALPNGNGAHGFTVRWVSANVGRTIFRGVWAYTAP